jgi:peptidoglycan/xylan/chitin deacetylase (PgdA/CDA1 family)
MNPDNNIDTKIYSHGNPRKIKILMYHMVTDDETFCRKYNNISVHVDAFRSQIKFLDRRGFTPITFEDYRLYLNGELNLPKKPVIITFDDGYQNIHKFAFPIMREYGVRGVLFIMADRKVKSNAWDATMGIPQLPLLDDQDIIEMQSAGFEIGSHSISHLQLPNVSRDKAWDEISRSRMILEILLNAPVKSFAYPYGLTNQAVKEMLKDAGYDIGCATYTGPPIFGQDNFEIRRILVSGLLNLGEFAFRMLTPYQYYDWTRRQIKNILFRERNKSKPYYASNLK